MQLERCAWSGRQLTFNRPLVFKLRINPFSGESILEQEDLDIYVFAISYDAAVEQVQQEIGYIWDEYVMDQNAGDAPSRVIALQLSELVASFKGAV